MVVGTVVLKSLGSIQTLNTFAHHNSLGPNECVRQLCRALVAWHTAIAMTISLSRCLIKSSGFMGPCE